MMPCWSWSRVALQKQNSPLVMENCSRPANFAVAGRWFWREEEGEEEEEEGEGEERKEEEEVTCSPRCSVTPSCCCCWSAP